MLKALAATKLHHSNPLFKYQRISNRRDQRVNPRSTELGNLNIQSLEVVSLPRSTTSSD